MRGWIRRLQALRCFVVLARDPRRLDVVFDLRASLDDPAVLEPIVRRLSADPRVARALAARPRVGRLELASLRALPEGSVGRVYAEWMTRMGLSPEAIPELPASSELEYFPAHLYETHDLWHVVTGFGPDVPGELGLQAFYLAQLGGPLPLAILAAGLLNTLGHLDDADARMDAITEGYRLGKASEPLFGLDWRALLSRPLVDVRRELGIPTPARGDSPLSAMAA
jgi:ubiquinone biosynthesis protein COQ4